MFIKNVHHIQIFHSYSQFNAADSMSFFFVFVYKTMFKFQFGFAKIIFAKSTIRFRFQDLVIKILKNLTQLFISFQRFFNSR